MNLAQKDYLRGLLLSYPKKLNLEQCLLGHPIMQDKSSETFGEPRKSTSENSELRNLHMDELDRQVIDKC